jgi:hypothetical protein
MQQLLLRSLVVTLVGILAWGEPAQSGAQTTSTRLVFVPYDKDTGPKLGNDQSVLLPYAEFLKLKAHETSGTDSRPEYKPAASISQSEFRGVVKEQVAVIDTTYTIEVLARPKDELEVLLPFDRAAIERISLTGPDATPSPLETGSGVRLVLRGPGRRLVSLRLVTPVVTDAAVRQVVFRIPRAAASSLILDVPDDTILEPRPESQPATLETKSNGRTQIVASSGAGEWVSLAFRSRVERMGGAAQTRVSANLDYVVKVAPASVQAEIKLSAKVLAGATAGLNFQMPEGWRLLSVSGAFVKDWSPVADDRSVSVSLIRELSQPFELLIQTQQDQSSTASQVSIPSVVVADAVRQTGTILVLPAQEPSPAYARRPRNFSSLASGAGGV